MAPGWQDHLVVFLVAFGVTVLLTPAARWLAFRVGAVVAPDERRIHAVTTPTLGGAAILLGVLAALGAAWRLDAFRPVFDAPTQPIGIALAAVLIYAVGLADDLRELSAPAKMAGIVLAGSVLSFAGVSLVTFRVPLFDVVILSGDLSAVVTVVWVVLMANAVNLIDGLDGLAAGIVAIASAAFFFYTVELTDESVLSVANPGALIAVAACGACLGFLPHNFHPARIFMGDGGALVLGLLMAASTISVGGQSSESYFGQTFFFFAPLIIPLVILGVPVADMTFAIFRRARGRVSIATADKGHLHHRLMNLGHGQRRSVVILWLWTALLSGAVLYPTYTGEGVLLTLFVIAALVLLLFTIFHPRLRARA
ncbi:MAG: undecaprenyl/decaprenyl-phosphate alpha-N-acetylglucosaminyl 1-phosphate transferase [Acidimicrobiales bacterium]|nr:undecaprenyl/decaprenyl-phosphate alpha-N-acetylglucosaminyl 1-phosphate transferase [Acidimicrobiales bacterium]